MKITKRQKILIIFLLLASVLLAGANVIQPLILQTIINNLAGPFSQTLRILFFYLGTIFIIRTGEKNRDIKVFNRLAA